jgi:hypothetical protein
MSSTSYLPLSRQELDVLLAPDEEATARAWDDLTTGLNTLLHLMTATYMRPLIPEETAREMIPEALRVLEGTPFHARALHNAQAIEEIERRFREHGPSMELYRAVDECIEVMLDEWNAIQYYPEPPPILTPLREVDPRFEWQYAAGGR